MNFLERTNRSFVSHRVVMADGWWCTVGQGQSALGFIHPQSLRLGGLFNDKAEQNEMVRYEITIWFSFFC